MQKILVWFFLLDKEPNSGSPFSSFLHILPLKQWKVWEQKLVYGKCLWISYFFIPICNFGSVIYLSLSAIPIWTHQRRFVLNALTILKLRNIFSIVNHKMWHFKRYFERILEIYYKFPCCSLGYLEIASFKHLQICHISK